MVFLNSVKEKLIKKCETQCSQKTSMTKSTFAEITIVHG